MFLQGLREVRLCLTLHNDYRSIGVCQLEFSLSQSFISFHIKCSISHQPSRFFIHSFLRIFEVNVYINLILVNLVYTNTM